MLPRYALRIASHGLAATLAAMASFNGTAAFAQTFTRITTATNPIVSDPASPSNSYVGASWVDYNGDGNLDLFVNRRALYRNDGAGAFTKLSLPFIGQGPSLGNTWGDFDNDGDLDAFTFGWEAGAPSYLYVNIGSDSFNRVSAGVIGDSLENQGLGAAWGDYDDDGYLDLAIVYPDLGVNRNHLYHNNGNGTFSPITTTDLTVGPAPYTMPTWSDFDLDGDLDLFVGAGPANGTTAPDYLYRNTQGEGAANPLVRITTSPLATDAHDGQVWNWIDYDNDGDLDVYVTNYGGPTVGSGVQNDLYRNDGGAFTRLTGAVAGPIVTDAAHSLASVWEDYDNDGDLDCVVTNDVAEFSRYYRNNGDGSFTSLSLAPLTSTAGPHYGACAGDYDNDGDVDLFVTGITSGGKMLLRNDTAAGNHWLELHLAGTASNRSAIGARVRVRAILGGQPVWQLREISALNSWAGQNSLVAHFGLGDAATADSIVVEWPAGGIQRLISVPANARYEITEEQTTPVEISVLRAVVVANGVELAWEVAGAYGLLASLERREPATEWAPLARLGANGERLFAYQDTGAVPGHRYGYRLRILDDGVERVLGEAWVDVPDRSLRLLGARPNPARGHLAIAFTLPAGGPARLELLDLAGRRLRVRDVNDLGAGTHVVTLEDGEPLPAGVYLVRLSRAGASVTTRVAILE